MKTFNPLFIWSDLLCRFHFNFLGPRFWDWQERRGILSATLLWRRYYFEINQNPNQPQRKNNFFCKGNFQCTTLSTILKLCRSSARSGKVQRYATIVKRCATTVPKVVEKSAEMCYNSKGMCYNSANSAWQNSAECQ